MSTLEVDRRAEWLIPNHNPNWRMDALASAVFGKTITWFVRGASHEEHQQVGWSIFMVESVVFSYLGARSTYSDAEVHSILEELRDCTTPLSAHLLAMDSAVRLVCSAPLDVRNSARMARTQGTQGHEMQLTVQRLFTTWVRERIRKLPKESREKWTVPVLIDRRRNNARFALEGDIARMRDSRHRLALRVEEAQAQLRGGWFAGELDVEDKVQRLLDDAAILLR